MINKMSNSKIKIYFFMLIIAFVLNYLKNVDF